MRLDIVVLAAGFGKRMRSEQPKILHSIGGKAMLAHVLDTAERLNPERCIIVYGHGGERVQAAFADKNLIWVEQAELKGTADAVAKALPHLSDDGITAVLYGDCPLVRPETLQALIDSAAADRLGLLTAVFDDPGGYGRIVRDAAGEVLRIVEDKDAAGSEKLIGEINTGVLAVANRRLRAWLPRIGNDNAQGEYYLTDMIAMAVAEGIGIDAHIASDPSEGQGVNNRLQLAQLERVYQRRQAERLMLQGATLRDPERVDIRGRVSVGIDVVIDVNVILEGEVELDDRVSIGPNSVIRNSRIGEDSTVLANCVIDEVEIGRNVQVGPFARLRPGAQLADKARVGNFVEVKQARIGEGSKVNHLSYIGDADIGRDVNVGAGTITCNYDGANKHKTVIEDEVFVGSNTALVAPIRVGEKSTVGAGSVLSKDVPSDVLIVTRAPSKQIKGWQRPKKR